MTSAVGKPNFVASVQQGWHKRGCTQVLLSLLVGVVAGQMVKLAVSAFHKAAEGSG